MLITFRGDVNRFEPWRIFHCGVQGPLSRETVNRCCWRYSDDRSARTDIIIIALDGRREVGRVLDPRRLTFPNLYPRPRSEEPSE